MYMSSWKESSPVNIKLLETKIRIWPSVRAALLEKSARQFKVDQIMCVSTIVQHTELLRDNRYNNTTRVFCLIQVSVFFNSIIIISHLLFSAWLIFTKFLFDYFNHSFLTHTPVNEWLWWTLPLCFACYLW